MDSAPRRLTAVLLQKTILLWGILADCTVAEISRKPTDNSFSASLDEIRASVGMYSSLFMEELPLGELCEDVYRNRPCNKHFILMRWDNPFICIWRRTLFFKRNKLLIIHTHSVLVTFVRIFVFTFHRLIEWNVDR